MSGVIDVYVVYALYANPEQKTVRLRRLLFAYSQSNRSCIINRRVDIYPILRLGNLAHLTIQLVFKVAVRTSGEPLPRVGQPECSVDRCHHCVEHAFVEALFHAAREAQVG